MHERRMNSQTLLIGGEMLDEDSFEVDSHMADFGDENTFNAAHRTLIVWKVSMV